MAPGNRTTPAAVAIVGFGAAVALVGAGSVGSDRRGGSAAADTVLTAVAVVVGLTALGFAVLVARRTRRPPSSEVSEASTIPAFLLKPLLAPLVATLLLLLFSALVLGPCLEKDRTEPFPPRGAGGPTSTAPVTGAPAHTTHDHPDWSVVTGLVLGAAGLALAAMTVRSRRRSPVEPDGPALDAEIARSLADLDGLASDPDHRRVVIRTYARMELALGRTGVERQPSETPQEYLRRAMADLGVGSGSAGELTALFEQARFSTHPVDAAMRARAAQALRAVRGEIPEGAVRSG